MPTIVKYKYVGPLLAALRDNAGASAAQIAAGLNTPTEGVGVVAEVSTADFVAVMSADALAKMKDYATTAATAEKDATRAAAIGLLTHLDAGTVSMVAGTEARKCVDALSAAGFLSVDEVGKLTSLATRPGAGPSAAQTMGLGECLPQFIAQVAEYEKLTEAEVKAQLAALLFVQWLRPRYATLASAEEARALPEYAAFCANVVLPYTEMADQKAADIAFDETFALLQGRVAEQEVKG